MEKTVKKTINDYIHPLLKYIQQKLRLDIFYLASNSFWTSLNFTLSSIFSLVLLVFFANFLSKESYGIYRYIMSISGALAFLTLSGMNTAVTQAVARGHEGILSYALKVQLRWNLVFLAGSIIAGGYYLFKGNGVIGIAVMILGITFPFLSAFNTYGSFLSGKKEFKRLALWGTVTNAVYTLAMIIAIVVSKNIVFLVTIYALTNLLLTMICYFKTITIFKPNRELHEGEKKETLKFGIHLSFVNIFSNLSQYIDKISVFHFVGAIELATYGLAMAIPERIRGYTKGLNSIVLPRLAEKTMEEIGTVFYKRVLQTMVVGTVISIAYIIVSPFVFKIFLPTYLESIRYSQVISISFVATLPLSYMASVFRAQKLIKTIYLSGMIIHSARIALFIIFGALWGVWGVVAASLSVYFASLFYDILLWELELRRQKMV